jgi:Fibronectin type III domain
VCGLVLALAMCGVVATPEPASAASVPVPPRSVRVEPGNARAAIRWHKPSNGGSPITAYEIAVYHDSVSLGIYQFQSSATTQTIVGLKNGQTLTFKVGAKNSAGWSKLSALSAPATIGSPKPIGTPTAAAGSGRATVSWHAAGANGAAVNQYRVTPRIDGHAKTTRVFKNSKTRQVMTGLAHGKKYTFEVAAHNARGWSAPSNLSAEIKIK